MLNKYNNKDGESDKERMQRIIEQRTKLAYSGTSSKLRYNQGLKGKHQSKKGFFIPNPRDLHPRTQGWVAGVLIALIFSFVAHQVIANGIIALAVSLIMILFGGVVGYVIGGIFVDEWT